MWKRWLIRLSGTVALHLAVKLKTCGLYLGSTCYAGGRTLNFDLVLPWNTIWGYVFTYWSGFVRMLYNGVGGAKPCKCFCEMIGSYIVTSMLVFILTTCSSHFNQAG
jgi:hypothetical protein